MKTESKTITMIGKLEENPWGNWSDVDKGWYVDRDSILKVLYDFEDKKVRLTITEIEEDSE